MASTVTAPACSAGSPRAWTLEELRFLHLRPQGASQKGIWTGRVRAGFGQYFMGTSPLYYLASAIYRLPRHPPLLGSAAMLWGYFSSAWKRVPRYDDAEFRRFLRRYQRSCLVMGKRAATARVNAKQARPGAGRAPGSDERRRSVDRCERTEFLGLPFDGLPMGDALERCLSWCHGSACIPHGHHRQRLHPLHDAARSGAARGMPRRGPGRRRRHVGGLGVAAAPGSLSGAGHRASTS